MDVCDLENYERDGEGMNPAHTVNVSSCLEPYATNLRSAVSPGGGSDGQWQGNDAQLPV